MCEARHLPSLSSFCAGRTSCCGTTYWEEHPSSTELHFPLQQVSQFSQWRCESEDGSVGFPGDPVTCLLPGSAEGGLALRDLQEGAGVGPFGPSFLPCWGSLLQAPPSLGTSGAVPLSGHHALLPHCPLQPSPAAPGCPRLCTQAADPPACFPKSASAHLEPSLTQPGGRAAARSPAQPRFPQLVPTTREAP